MDLVCQQQTSASTEKVCYRQIDGLLPASDNAGMAQTSKNRPKLAGRDAARRRRGPQKLPVDDLPSDKPADDVLHLGAWLDRLDLKQIDVARAAFIGKAYMNNLVNPPPGKKPKNPSVQVMLRISRAMGVTVNALYTPAPSRDQVAAARRMHPAHIAAGVFLAPPELN